MKNNLETLTSLARGAKNLPVDFDAEAAYGDSWLEKKEEFLQNSKGLDTAARFSAFQSEMKDYKFTRQNVDSYYETYGDLFPGTVKEAEEHVKMGMMKELSELPSDLEKAKWTQKNLKRIPTKWYGQFGEYFKRLREKQANKMYERTRITSILRGTKALNNIGDQKIDASKDINSYVRQFVKIETHGLTDTMEIDEEGDYTVLTETGRQKSTALPDIEDPVTMFLAWHDFEPIVRKAVMPQIDDTAKFEKQLDDIATGQMRRDIAKLPSEFHANIITDWAMMQDPEKPADHMRGALRELVTNDIKAGLLTSPDEIIWKYINKRNDVLNSYLGRRIHGT